jgi:hypothetical protein
MPACSEAHTSTTKTRGAQDANRDPIKCAQGLVKKKNTRWLVLPRRPALLRLGKEHGRPPSACHGGEGDGLAAAVITVGEAAAVSLEVEAAGAAAAVAHSRLRRNRPCPVVQEAAAAACRRPGHEASAAWARRRGAPVAPMRGRSAASESLPGDAAIGVRSRRRRRANCLKLRASCGSSRALTFATCQWRSGHLLSWEAGTARHMLMSHRVNDARDWIAACVLCENELKYQLPLDSISTFDTQAKATLCLLRH